MKPAVKIIRTSGEFLRFIRNLGFVRSIHYDSDPAILNREYGYGNYNAKYIMFMDGSPCYCGYVENAVMFHTYSYSIPEHLLDSKWSSGTGIHVYIYDTAGEWTRISSDIYCFRRPDIKDIDKRIKAEKSECMNKFHQLINILSMSKDVPDFMRKFSMFVQGGN